MTDPSWMPVPEGDQTLEENWLFRLRRERFRSRISGKTHDYYVLHLPDAVNVIAVTPDRRVVFVRQFRAGSGRDSLESPGGLIDPGEDACQAAVRELREETGYVGDPPALVSAVWANPSILNCRQFTVVIENAVRTCEPSPDASEELAVELVPADDVSALIQNGAIDHALVVCGLLRWLLAALPGPLQKR